MLPFSGLVSGVTTFVVGLIIYLQAKHYNDESTKFIEKQFELEQAKSIIQSRLLFVNDFKNMWTKFVDDCNPAKMSDDLLVLVNDSYGKPAYEQTARLLVKSAMETTTLCNSIQNHIILDYLDDDKKNEYQDTTLYYIDPRRGDSHYSDVLQLASCIVDDDGGEQLSS